MDNTLSIRLKIIDEAWVTVLGDREAVDALAAYLTYEKPGARYTPAYKRGWDGRIRILKSDRKLYRGLIHRVEEFCNNNGYAFDCPAEKDDPPSEASIKQFVTSLKLPEHIVVRDYQYQMLTNAVRYGRRLFLSPTSSGKSLGLYLIAQWFKKKTLIIVPRKGLGAQLPNDFLDYGCDPKLIHKISDGIWTDKLFTIATWQTAVKQPQEWFDQFRVVIGDEAHGAKAESLVRIFTSLTNCPVRIGCTGTLDGKKVHQLIIEGMFGPVETVTTYKELIDRNFVAKPKINIIILEHPEWARKKLRSTINQERAKRKATHRNAVGTAYREEQKWLYGCAARVKFIENLVMSRAKNTMVLFHRVEQQGKVLLKALKPRLDAVKRSLYFVDGKTDVDVREEIRQTMETEENAVWLASFGTSSEGISVKRIFSLILASSFKSPIRILQSIGRGIRIIDGKTSCEIFDIADDLSVGSFVNSSQNHLEERIKIYDQELFEYKIHRVKLNYEEKVIDGNHGGLHEVAVRGRNHGATGTVES